MKNMNSMSNETAALVYFLAGSALLSVALKLFKVEFKLWQPVLASALAALCVYLPDNVRGVISLVVLLATMRFITGESWQNLIYPVVIARLALFPVLLLVRVV